MPITNITDSGSPRRLRLYFLQMLSIHLFGPPQILLDERPVQITRRKSRALLYYLAASPIPCRREALLAFFWPDEERSAGQQVLRTTLYGLRKELGEALVIERESAALADSARVDARRLEAGLNGGQQTGLPALEAALDLYRGEFLEGFSLPDSGDFESWLAVERQHYRQLVTGGLTTLSHAYEARRDYVSALAALQRALHLDALQEDVQRDVLRLLYLSGDRAGAIRRYDELRRLLDEELGVPPMAVTRALYDDILNDRLKEGVPSGKIAGPSGKRPADSGALPFTSREEELSALRDEIFSARLVLLEGEAGIGKTRLADHFLEGLDATILCGAGRELEQSLPYQPVVEALRGLLALPQGPDLLNTVRKDLPPIWLAETARLLPELEPRQPAVSADEWRLWEGISQFLQALARRRPLVLFLDDLQWADAPTLGMLGYLVRRASGPRVGFLGAARPFTARTPLANLTQALIREQRLARHFLRRFSPAEIQAIAEKFSPGYAQILAGWLGQNSEGNPYILAELLRDARGRGILTPDGAVNLSRLSGAPPVPVTVYSLIQARLAHLGENARRLLDAAAAIGFNFEFEVASRASGLPEEDALDALDEAVSSGFIRPQGEGRYEFDHSLTLEVASREIGPERHRHMHRAVASALEDLYRTERLQKIPGLLAYHYREGNDPVRAAPYALQAGRQAASVGAWHEAAAFFEQALAGSGEQGRFELLMDLGWALVRSVEAARASDIFSEAVSLAEAGGDRAGAARARIALAQSYLPQSRFQETIATVNRLLDEEDPLVIFSAELWWGTALSLEGSNLDEAERHLTRAADICRQSAGPVALAQVEFELGSIAAQKGNLRGAVEHYRSALEDARQSDTPEAVERQVLSHNNLAYHLLLLGDPSAREHALAGLELAREKGVLAYQVYLYSTLGEISLASKQDDEAERWFNLGLDLARQLLNPERIAGITANLGRLSAERGETALAIHRLSSAMAQADALGTRHLAAQIRIWLAPLLPPAEGKILLEEARTAAENSGRKRLLDEANSISL